MYLRMDEERQCRRWSDEEVQFLRGHYLTMTSGELSKKLSRNTSAIRCKASKLKIRKNLSRIRECQACGEIKWIIGRNLCKRCYGRT